MDSASDKSRLDAAISRSKSPKISSVSPIFGCGAGGAISGDVISGDVIRGDAAAIAADLPLVDDVFDEDDDDIMLLLLDDVILLLLPNFDPIDDVIISSIPMSNLAFFNIESILLSMVELFSIESIPMSFNMLSALLPTNMWSAPPKWSMDICPLPRSLWRPPVVTSSLFSLISDAFMFLVVLLLTVTDSSIIEDDCIEYNFLVTLMVARQVAGC